MISLLAVCLTFAVFNRARGSQFWNLIASTTVSRIAATFAMAAATLFPTFGMGTIERLTILCYTWAALFFWCVFAWDKYWSAAIGNPTNLATPAFVPVDWIMKQLPAMPLRLWGTLAMGLRQSLAAVCLAGLALLIGDLQRAALAPLTLLQGLPYLAGGYISKTYPVAIAEFTVGAVLGFLVYQSIR